MKKRLKKILNKKGVTLAELLVVLVITAILMTIAFNMLKITTNLMNSLTGNAHMDTMSDVANEYIRNCMDKSVAVSAVPYSNLDALKATWKTYTDRYTTAKGYSVRALGVMQNFNGDSRLYDFGKVNVIDCKWGENDFHLQSANDGIAYGTAFVTMIRDRDGGPDATGVYFNNFHKFDVFNDAFYSNGNESTTNYSFEVAFEVEEEEISNGTATITGVSRVTLYSQIFKRTTEKVTDDAGNVKNVLSFEPANQARSITFNMLNGTAELDVSQSVNKLETEADGTKSIKVTTDADGGHEGLVILYVVRDSDFMTSGAYTPLPSLKPSFEISGGGIYGGFSGNWFGINDQTLDPPQTPLVIKNNSGSSIDTKYVTVEFSGDFIPEVKELYLNITGNANVSNAGTIPWPINEQNGNLFKVTLGNWYHDEENDKWEIRGQTWKDGETLTISKMEIKGKDASGNIISGPILTSSGKITIYVQGKVVWSKTVKKTG